MLASLFMVEKALPKLDGSSKGIAVLLSRKCTRQELMNRGDGSDFFVRYRLDHSSFINGELQPTEDELRRSIASVMATRQEQLLHFAADSRLTYGEVSSVLSDLRMDDPNLYIVLLMEEQIVPVDKIDWSKFEDLCFAHNWYQYPL